MDQGVQGAADHGVAESSMTERLIHTLESIIIIDTKQLVRKIIPFS